MRIKKRCGNCLHYFINRDFAKLCVDKTTDDAGKLHIKANHELGMMGDEQMACERWEPAKWMENLK